jgi:hypothetical protein
VDRAEVDASAGDVRGSVRTMMERHWVSAGYTAPNSEVYPWLWLWDSCFHALIWLELGDSDRAVTELRAVFSTQTASGFVPHMGYMLDPEASRDFWGRSGSSSITQPPMYGHAVAELIRAGVDVPADLIDAAAKGLDFLLTRRKRHASGLILLVHPWESGADDSPRWDSACPGGYSPEAWFDAKGAWVGTIETSAAGDPIANPGFEVASAGFNALVVFNAEELAAVAGDGFDHAAERSEVSDALVNCWDSTLGTWTDRGLTETGSASVRTVDALLPTLIEPDPARVLAVGEALLDASAYGGAFGPAGVHRAEPFFDARAYWRGAAWPQLSYLLALAQERAGNPEVASELRIRLRRGALESALAEYWDPDDGTGLGAIPQSWAGVTVVAGS